MKKGWRIIGAAVLIIVLVGAVFVGVGYLTGADWDRIFNAINETHKLEAWIQWFRDSIDAVKAANIF